MAIDDDVVDSAEVLDLRFADGAPLWPFCRFAVLRHLFEQRTATSVPSLGAPASLGQRLRRWRDAAAHMPLRATARDLVFLTTAAGLQRQPSGRYRDRIHDGFVLEQAERTMVLEPAHAGSHPRPRLVPHVRYVDVVDVVAGLPGWVRRPAARDEQSIAALGRLLATTSASPAFIDGLMHQLSWIAATRNSHRAAWSHVLDAVAPRILIIEEASYGGRAGLLALAHERGIVTAEIQHGVIPSRHHAYSLGSALLRSSEFRRFFPLHLLLYGSFWSNQVTSWSRKTVVGSPTFSDARRRWRPRPRRRPRLLCVSQPESTAEVVALAQRLARAGRDRFDVVFRPHPIERAAPDRYASVVEDGVAIDEAVDAYDALASVDAVVGTASTLLFEAAGLGLPVFVYENVLARHYLPRDFGVWFNDVDGFMDRWPQGPSPTTQAWPAATALFADDWQGAWARWRDGVEAGRLRD